MTPRAERAGCVRTSLPRGGQSRQLQTVEVRVAHGMDDMAQSQQLADQRLEARDLAAVALHKRRAVRAASAITLHARHEVVVDQRDRPVEMTIG